MPLTDSMDQDVDSPGERIEDGGLSDSSIDGPSPEVPVDAQGALAAFEPTPEEMSPLPFRSKRLNLLVDREGPRGRGRAEHLTAWSENAYELFVSLCAEDLTADDPRAPTTEERLAIPYISLPLRRMAAMPRVRDCDWRYSYHNAYSIKLMHHEAVLMQMTGTPSENPCVKCYRGAGPFDSCITSPKVSRGSCANCRWGSQSSLCSLRKTQKDGLPSPLNPMSETQTLAHRGLAGTRGQAALDGGRPKRKSGGARATESKTKRQALAFGTSVKAEPKVPVSIASLGRSNGDLEMPLVKSDIATDIPRWDTHVQAPGIGARPRPSDANATWGASVATSAAAAGGISERSSQSFIKLLAADAGFRPKSHKKLAVFLRLLADALDEESDGESSD